MEFPPDFDFAGLDLPGRHFKDGVSQSGRERNHLFANVAGQAFVDVSGVSGFDHEADGRALALLDFDRDGWQDFAVVNANAPLFQLFHNELGSRPGASGGAIAIEFEGANHGAAANANTSPRDGFGAKVEVRSGGRVLLREYRAGEGFAAQNAPRLLVGLGSETAAESVSVRWPSGVEQVAARVPAGSRVVFREGAPDAPVEVDRYLRVTAAARPPASQRDAFESLLPTLPKQSGELRVFTTLATWCEACRKELPQVALLRSRFDAERISLYGVPVDRDDTRAKLLDWRAEQRPAYDVLIDLPAEDIGRITETVQRRLRADALPASIVTDDRGRVLLVRWGVPTVSDLERLLAEHVKSPKAGG